MLDNVMLVQWEVKYLVQELSVAFCENYERFEPFSLVVLSQNDNWHQSR